MSDDEDDFENLCRFLGITKCYRCSGSGQGRHGECERCGGEGFIRHPYREAKVKVKKAKDEE